MYRYIPLLIFIAAISACKPDEDLSKIKGTSWNPEVAFPLLKADVTARDIIDKFQNDTIIEEDQTGFLTLVYNSEIFSTRGENLVNIPDQQFGGSFSLPPVEIADFTLSDYISLGEIAQGLNEPERSDIINAHGTNQNFPAVPTQDAGSFPYTVSSDFTTLTLSSGTLSLTVQNNLPVTIDNLQIDLINKDDNSTVASFFYNFIAANSSKTENEDVSGRTISDNMEVQVPSIGSPGTTTPVLIDTSDQVVLTFSGSNIVASGGTAVIPQQSQPISRDTFSYIFSSGEQLNTLILKAGTAAYSRTFSDFGSGLDIVLKFPYVTQNGTPFEEQFSINSANSQFDLTGYRFDLTAGGNLINAVVVEYNLNSEGQEVSFNTGDSLSYNFSIDNAVLSYADGYIGTQNFNLDEDSIRLNIYDNWVAGSVYFEDPKISLIIRNSYGIPIRANIDRLSAYSSKTNQTWNIQGEGSNNPIDNPINFNYPSQPGQSAITTVAIDKNNSNIEDVISNSPNAAIYDFSATANPDGNTGQLNFLTDTSYFAVSVDVELPFYGRVEGMEIKDTFGIDVEVLNNIEYAEFRLYTQNSFPVNAFMQLYFADANAMIIDSLLAPPKNILEAGKINSLGKVISPSKVLTDIPVDAERVAAIRDAELMILKVILQTPPNPADNNNIRIYSDNGIKMNLGVKTKTAF